MPIGPFRRRDPIRVQPFYGYRSAEQLFLNARALRSREARFEKRSFMRDVATMAGQYLSREVAGLGVTLEYELADGRVVSEQVVTDVEGYALFDLALEGGAPVGKRTAWEKATIRWRDEDGSANEATAHILVPGSETQIGLISDIDDTIVETGITGSFRMIARNWKRVMRQMPSDRVVVPGAAAFYAALGGNPERTAAAAASEAIDAIEPMARVRPVFYVSSSPWNLFSYLVTFKRSRGLPLGPVALRDWGLNRRILGSEGHGDHKRDAIERILETFPHMKFALLGDDSQKDLAAFGAVAKTHAGRIAAVFIRSISGEPLNAEERAAKDAIEQAGVPFWTGSDYREARLFLKGAGLDVEGVAVERLVRAASEGEAPMPPAGTGQADTGQAVSETHGA